MSSPDNTESESYPLTSLSGRDPDIDSLVNDMVRSRIEETEKQFVAQLKAWQEQETSMHNREAEMRETIQTLNDKLARATENQQMHRSSTSTGTETSVLPDGASQGSSDHTVSGPRKRRRKASIPVSDAAPARNTRSNRRAQSADATIFPIVPVQPQSSTIPLERPTIPVQPAVIPTEPPVFSAVPPFNSSNTNQWAPTSRMSPPIQDVNVSARPAKRSVVKPATHIYRLLPQDIPDDVGGLQTAMSLHLRILWGLLDSKQVPKNPPAQVLQQFGMRFSSETELFACQESGPELIPRHLVQIGTAMSSVRGRIANNARLVEEHMLSYIQAQLSRFGLFCWCPDLRQSAYSLYNAACRIVALDTFKQAIISHAYVHLNPNTTYATNMDLLIKLYDHFIFHFMQRRYQKETRTPGSVKQELQSSPQYQARIRLAFARRKFLEDNHYPQRYCDLIESKATSDDEYDPIQKAYVIRHRPERSEKAEEFIRILDRKREQDARQDPSRKWRQRVRIVPPAADRRDSVFRILPDNMPIDYFDPTYFNQLQPKTRNRIAIRKVSLLPDVSQSLTWNADEQLSNKAFTKKYGAPVFARYQMVSDADMARGDDDDDEWASGDEEDDEMSVSEQDAEIDITLSRNNLSAHLSGSQ